MIINHYDHFTLGVILKNLMGAIRVRVLIDQTVACVIPDEFNRLFQLFSTTNTVRFIRHFMMTMNRISPQEHGNRGFNRVF